MNRTIAFSALELNIAVSITKQELTNAYRALARRHHPDRTRLSVDADTTKMQEINNAYTFLLTNPHLWQAPVAPPVPPAPATATARASTPVPPAREMSADEKRRWDSFRRNVEKHRILPQTLRRPTATC